MILCYDTILADLARVSKKHTVLRWLSHRAAMVNAACRDCQRTVPRFDAPCEGCLFLRNRHGGKIAESHYGL